MSAAAPSPSPPALPRDLAILQHVARYHLTTPPVLQTQFLARCGLEAVSKVTARLCRQELLMRHRLPQRGIYYVLGPAGARRLGVPRHRTRPLGAQTLPEQLAVLWYAFTGPVVRARLTPQELQDRFPGMIRAGGRDIYCQAAAAGNSSSADKHPLDWLRLDRGTAPDHLVRKCAQLLEQRCQRPPFATGIRSGQLRLVVLTATAEKRQALRAAFDRRTWPTGLRLHVVVMPRLFTLWGGAPDAA